MARRLRVSRRGSRRPTYPAPETRHGSLAAAGAASPSLAWRPTSGRAAPRTRAAGMARVPLLRGQSSVGHEHHRPLRPRSAAATALSASRSARSIAICRCRGHDAGRSLASLTSVSVCASSAPCSCRRRHRAAARDAGSLRGHRVCRRATRREIGLRVALGSQPMQIGWLVTRQAARHLGSGCRSAWPERPASASYSSAC